MSDPTATAAPTPGAITLLRDGHRLATQGGTFSVEWADWARRVSKFLQDYDAVAEPFDWWDDEGPTGEQPQEAPDGT